LLLMIAGLLVAAGCENPAGEENTTPAASEYSITVTQPENGSFTVKVGDGTPTGGNTKAAPGATVTLTATADTNYQFKQWIVGGLTLPDAATVAFTMPLENLTVTAEFESGTSGPTTYGITVTPPANGSFTVQVGGDSPTNASTTSEAGTTITLAATADPSYQFKQWNVSGVTLTTTGNPATFTMPAGPVTVTAEFEVIPPTTYTITAQTTANGSFTVKAGSTNVTEAMAGASITLTATADPDYQFKQWNVTGVTLDDDTANPATFTMPAGAVTVTVEFESAVVNPTLTFNAGNAENGPEPVSVAVGTPVPAPVTTGMTNEGFTFGGWFTDTTLRYPVTFPITVNEDTEVYAKWDNGKALRIWQNTSWNVAGQVVQLTAGTSYTLGAEYKFGSTWSGGKFAVTYSLRYKDNDEMPVIPYMHYKEHENPQTWTISEDTFTAPVTGWYCVRIEDSGRTNQAGAKSDKEIFINRAWLYAEDSTENMLAEADFGDYLLYNVPGQSPDNFLDANGNPQYFNDAQNVWDQHCIDHWGITGGSNFGDITNAS
jgi:hypothetical protein